jgi:hypothetical protein
MPNVSAADRHHLVVLVPAVPPRLTADAAVALLAILLASNANDVALGSRE